jgi:hypothetical protein
MPPLDPTTQSPDALGQLTHASDSCAPERDLPSLATIFSQTLTSQVT